MAAGDKKNKFPRKEPTTDPRFISVKTDPRFKKYQKKSSTLREDDRFQSMKTNKAFKISTHVDRFGRKVSGIIPKDKLKEKLHTDSKVTAYYDSETDEDFDDIEEEDEEEEDEEEDEDIDDEDEVVAAPAAEYDPLRGIGVSDSDSESDIDYDDPTYLDRPSGEEESENEIDPVEYDDEQTHRLAVLNMEWDVLDSESLFAVLNSFKPNNGVLKSVSIYMSDFGKEQTQKESVYGPSVFAEITQRKLKGAQKSKQKRPTETNSSAAGDASDTAPELTFESDVQNEDEDVEEEEEEDESEQSEQSETEAEVDDTGRPEVPSELEDLDELYEEELDDTSKNKIKKYQLQRMKYFYAVAVFDSVDTARTVYEECDGQEYLNSGILLDLRFIPDDQVFEDTPRDTCTFVSKTFTPVDFQSSVLNRTSVKCTWDTEDKSRARDLRRNITEEDLDLMDYSKYLGTDSEADEDELETKKQTYRKMYADLVEEEAQAELQDLPGQEMEITFDTDDVFSGRAGKDAKKKTSSGADTSTLSSSWDTYLQQKKSKKTKEGAAAKATDSAHSVSSSKFSHQNVEDTNTAENEDEDGFDDDFFRSNGRIGGVSVQDSESTRRGTKKPPTREEKEERARGMAEAQLFTMDDLSVESMADGDHAPIKHFSYDQIVKYEKISKRKLSGKIKTKLMKDAPEDSFEIDTKDQRFTALYSKPEFAIDPTNPRFKSTKAMGKLMDERNAKYHAMREQEPKQHAQNKTSQTSITTQSAQVDSLVSKLKKKKQHLDTTSSQPSAKRSKHDRDWRV